MLRIILFSFVIIQSAIGGFERTEIGARASALGQAYVGLANDVSGLSFNPAGIADLSRAQVSVYYSPQPFGLTELATGNIAAALPIAVGTIGLSGRWYGFELYHEVSITAAYARTIVEIQCGISIHYDAVQIQNYGTAGTIGVDVGFIAPLMKQLDWGLTLRNVNAPTIGTGKEHLPRVFTTGIAYLPLPDLTLVFDIQKEISFPPSTRFGFEYWFFNTVAIRSGVSEKPTQFSAGIGVRYHFLQFDYAVSMHQELGWTHSFSLTFL